MTKDECRILDAVVEGGRALPVLVDVHMEAFLNRPGHSLPREELVGVLQHLFARGDLAYDRDENTDNPWLVSGQTPPTRQDVERMLIAPHPKSSGAYYYHLTPQGGARWERYAKPDWNRFLKGSIASRHDPEVAEALLLNPRIEKRHIYATNAAVIEQYLLTPNPASPGFLVGTPQWEPLAPWEATYWKTLPHAHRMTYWYRSSEENIPFQEREQKEREWKDLRTWYNNPFNYE